MVRTIRFPPIDKTGLIKVQILVEEGHDDNGEYYAIWEDIDEIEPEKFETIKCRALKTFTTE